MLFQWQAKLIKNRLIEKLLQAITLKDTRLKKADNVPILVQIYKSLIKSYLEIELEISNINRFQNAQYFQNQQYLNGK
jgi:hypothetical protein